MDNPLTLTLETQVALGLMDAQTPYPESDNDWFYWQNGIPTQILSEMEPQQVEVYYPVGSLDINAGKLLGEPISGNRWAEEFVKAASGGIIPEYKPYEPYKVALHTVPPILPPDPKAYVPPPTPAGLTAEVIGDKVELTWSHSGAGITGISGYEVTAYDKYGNKSFGRQIAVSAPSPPEKELTEEAESTASALSRYTAALKKLGRAISGTTGWEEV